MLWEQSSLCLERLAQDVEQVGLALPSIAFCHLLGELPGHLGSVNCG